MIEQNQKAAAKKFADYWCGRGYEKGESQPFWLSLLKDVYGIENPQEYIIFEEQVHLDHTSFIDAYIPSSKILIEQKSIDKDLNKAIRQSDGTLLTPFQQAKRYITELPLSRHPRWVITCNFSEFFIYDMEQPNCEPEKIKLADFEKEYYRLSFLVSTENEHIRKEMELSIIAEDIVGEIYDALLEEYIDKKSDYSLKSLNILCVRIVFCLYAEDAGIFGHHLAFYDYLKKFDALHMRKALQELFVILNTNYNDRDPYLEPDLANFPYVNGGLFSDDKIEIPLFTEKIRDLLLTKASSDFDWSQISPTIFGALFESILNPQTRRHGGMHYTSIENIHKLIDPLFMDDLNKEFYQICQIKIEKTREKKLMLFQMKLASLTWLDPACGSGNFLTETYLSVRRLENDILRILTHGQIVLADKKISPIKVSTEQFYGIEINDFAVTVARTALWIAQLQTNQQTADIIHTHIDSLPLKANPNIIEANALKIDWENIIPKNKLNYIMGNPPFAGKKFQTRAQKEDLINNFGTKFKGIGSIDYISGWFEKAINFMQNTNIQTAFVSTNSITQGEQVPILWRHFLNKGIFINFAYQTFKWNSESNLKAQVYCVIIGFSCINKQEKYIFSEKVVKRCQVINPYLISAPITIIEKRNRPICDVKFMFDGMYLSMEIF